MKIINDIVFAPQISEKDRRAIAETIENLENPNSPVLIGDASLTNEQCLLLAKILRTFIHET